MHITCMLNLYIHICHLPHSLAVLLKSRGSYHPNVSSQSTQFKIWDPHIPSTKSSILALRTVLNVLTLKFSVFPKPSSNKMVQILFKHAPNQLELNNILQVSSSSIIISLIFLCLHFLIFKCVISSILILKKS